VKSGAAVCNLRGKIFGGLNLGRCEIWGGVKSEAGCLLFNLFLFISASFSFSFFPLFSFLSLKTTNLSPNIYEKTPRGCAPHPLLKGLRPAPPPYGAAPFPPTRWALNVWLQWCFLTLTVHLASFFLPSFKSLGGEFPTPNHSRDSPPIFECVLICFINPILGNRHGPGVSSCQQTSDYNLGWPDPHPSKVRRWLYWSPPVPLQTDPQLLR